MFISPERLSLPRAGKQHEKCRNFYDCIQPLFVVSRIFGLLQFTVYTDSNDRKQRTSVGVLQASWFAGVIGIVMALVYITQHSTRSAAKSESSVVLLLDRWAWIIFLFMALSSVILSMIYRNRIARIIRTIIKFDKNVKFC